MRDLGQSVGAWQVLASPSSLPGARGSPDSIPTAPTSPVPAALFFAVLSPAGLPARLCTPKTRLALLTSILPPSTAWERRGCGRFPKMLIRAQLPPTGQGRGCVWLLQATISLSLPFFWSLVFWGPHPQHMEGPRLGVELEPQLPAYTTATATSDPSRICHLHHSSRQRRLLNPLREARERTCVLMDARRVLNPLNHSGDAKKHFKKWVFFLLLKIDICLFNLENEKQTNKKPKTHRIPPSGDVRFQHLDVWMLILTLPEFFQLEVVPCGWQIRSPPVQRRTVVTLFHRRKRACLLRQWILELVSPDELWAS